MKINDKSIANCNNKLNKKAKTIKLNIIII